MMMKSETKSRTESFQGSIMDLVGPKGGGGEVERRVVSVGVAWQPEFGL